MSTSESGSDSDDEVAVDTQTREDELILMVGYFVMNHDEKYLNKKPRRIPLCTGQQWVFENLSDPGECYSMFRMYPHCFHALHTTLVDNYNLKSTREMSSVEALGMFLWMVGGPQPVSQVKKRFKRSKETIHRKFEEVLCLVCLATDIIKPRDPQFSTLHSRLEDSRFYPHFNDCIGAIDGTHIRVVVPADEIVNHVGRYGYPTQNVMVVCDFDMRFTSVVSGWPGSAHDTRIFKDTLKKYEEEFPHPPPGKYYLVDSGYPNQTGYLAPYKGQKYHLPEFRQGRQPSGKQEVFNHAHASLRNVIERAFGVLKMKWRTLLHITSYPIEKQARIIVACMALYNWIRESNLHDKEFYKCDQNENYMPGNIQPEPSVALPGLQWGSEHGNMNVTRENISDALIGDV